MKYKHSVPTSEIIQSVCTCWRANIFYCSVHLSVL